MKIGIDFQTLVPNWCIGGPNFCFETRYKSNQDYGAPAAPPYPYVHGVNPPGFNSSRNKDVVTFRNQLYWEHKQFPVN